MFLKFDARCEACGNQFRAEADIGADLPADGQYRYDCPRCHAPGTAPAGHGLPCEAPTPWAVRAAPGAVGVGPAGAG